MSKGKVRICRFEQTLATYYAPPTKEYEVGLFKNLVSQIVRILGAKEWSAVSEPFPSDELKKSTWHFHIQVIWGIGIKKQISPRMQEKIEKLLGVDKKTHDYTMMSKGFNGAEKAVSDCKYAHGESKKEKEHFDVIESKGFAEWMLKMESRLFELKKTKKELDGFDPTKPLEFCYAMMERKKQKPSKIWSEAKKNKRIVLEMYVVKNLNMLEEMFSNIKKVQAEETMFLEELPKPNLMQTIALDIIDKSTNKREEGQLNCFIDPEGNSGKSVLQDMLYKEKDAAEFPNAKTADVAKAYNYEKIVNFNFARSTDMDKVNYRVVEDLADGKIFSSKYHSGMKRVSKPQINLFCNKAPVYEKLSLDRWNVYEWSKEKQCFFELNVYKELGMESYDKGCYRMPTIKDLAPDSSAVLKKRKLHDFFG